MFNKNFFLKLKKDDRLDIYTSICIDGSCLIYRNLNLAKVIIDEDYFSIRTEKKLIIMPYSSILRIDISSFAKNSSI